MTAIQPVVGGSVELAEPHYWAIQPLVLESVVWDALADPGASRRALERALDLAEVDGALLPFLLHPAPQLLERHRRRTTHAASISEILNMLEGRRSAGAVGGRDRLVEPLSQSETRVMRDLPTNLTGPEIASELFLSVNTVKTHLRHVYAKLSARNRSEAVRRGRVLGLLAPSSR